MNRKASSLTSLGISMALIAVVIWFLYNLSNRPWSHLSVRHTWHHGWMMGGGGIGVIMLIFWIMVIAAVILLIAAALSYRRSWPEKSPDAHALDCLKQQYARGEIDRKTFLAKQQELRQ